MYKTNVIGAVNAISRCGNTGTDPCNDPSKGNPQLATLCFFVYSFSSSVTTHWLTKIHLLLRSAE